MAVGYARAVTNACCGNIGGGGFMLLHLADKNLDRFISFRETAPAVRLAREGFILTRGDTNTINAGRARFMADPVASKIYSCPDGFYQGANAQRLAAAMRTNGGIMTKADLVGYTVTSSDPVRYSLSQL